MWAALRIGASGLRSSWASMARNSSLRRSFSRSSCSAARRAVMSRNTRTTPTTRPRPSRIGAPLSSIGTSVPSRPISTVWLARPTIAPSRRTLVTGFSTVFRVASLTIRKTSSTGRPIASASQRVRACAAGLSRVTRPCASVTITASPMLVSVVRKRSRSAWSTSAARWRIVRLRANSHTARATRPRPMASATTVVASAIRALAREIAPRSRSRSHSTRCIWSTSPRIASIVGLPCPLSTVCRAAARARPRSGSSAKRSSPRRRMASCSLAS